MRWWALGPMALRVKAAEVWDIQSVLIFWLLFHQGKSNKSMSANEAYNRCGVRLASNLIPIVAKKSILKIASVSEVIIFDLNISNIFSILLLPLFI